MERTEIKGRKFSGERPLFDKENLYIENCVFENGESPLKECRNIELSGCAFHWKYPLWYGRVVRADNCTWTEFARAGVWYTDNARITNCVIQGPKNFRRCNGLIIENTFISRAEETLWSCENVTLKNVSARGDYFLMNSRDVTVDGLVLDGNYSFDGVENAVIRNSKLLTKDAFWNSRNITVYDSYISGEYLGWNSKNLTLINCTVESLQGLCYIDGLKMRNCRLVNTTLAFEYTRGDVQVTSRVESVLNPSEGTFSFEGIGELIIEKDRVDEGRFRIESGSVETHSDRPEWLRNRHEI